MKAIKTKCCIVWSAVFLALSGCTFHTASEPQNNDPECRQLRNDVFDAAVELNILNELSEPIYVDLNTDGCYAYQPMWLEDQNGINMHMFAPWLTCNHILDGNCETLGMSMACTEYNYLYLEAGASWSGQWNGGTYELLTLPDHCVPESTCTDLRPETCHRYMQPATGTYTFYASAGTQVSQCSFENAASCDLGNGWCVIDGCDGVIVSSIMKAEVDFEYPATNTVNLVFDDQTPVDTDIDTEPAGTPCGEIYCNQATEICVECNCGGPTSYACEPVPTGCETNRTCGCVAPSICINQRAGSCMDVTDNTILCETGMD